MQDEQPTHEPFSPYHSYRSELWELRRQTWFEGCGSVPREALNAHLDGEAYKKLRELVPLRDRRQFSTFFTGSALRARLVAPYSSMISGGAFVVDPACGVGDLLVGAINELPADWSAGQILLHAAKYFSGRDLISVFSDVAKERIALAAFARSATRDARGCDVDQFVSMLDVTAGNGLAPDSRLRKADLVLLNPPFARAKLQNQAWGRGLASQAAPFALDVIRSCRPGTNIAAILPDALRSGPRYARWRDYIAKLVDICDFEIVGPFDQWTNIDVFIARMRVSLSATNASSCAPTRGEETLGDIVTVHVGDVVPHRHLNAGLLVPYLSVPDVPISAIVTSSPTRRFAGRLHRAPFVVARRTSAPSRGSAPRLLTSVVHTKLRDVAVENHLIVIKPSGGGLAACKMLAAELRSNTITAWLNDRIRTRHLSCQSIREIPLRLFRPNCKAKLGRVPE